MRRVRTLTGEVLLATTLVACTPSNPTSSGTTSHETEPTVTSPSQSTAEAPATPRLQALAGRIASMATDFGEYGFKSKPPYTVGVKLPVEGGGELALSVQTPNETADTNHPLALEVQQSGVPGRNFDASFLVMNNGSWTAFCTRSDGRTGSENSEQTYQFDNEPAITNPVVAEVILSDALQGSEGVVNKAAATFFGKALPPFEDICAFNLGDG